MPALDAYEAALAAARSVLDRHRSYGNGICVCLRPIVAPAGCSVALTASLYADHWRTRLDYHSSVESPTALMPLVAGSSERVWAGGLQGRYYR